MKLNTDVIVIGTGCSTATAGVWLAPLQAACDEFEINTPRRIGGFLANVGVECAGFTTLVENLNYSAQGLANTWKTRYAQNPAGPAPYVPNDLAYSLARKPEAIANNCYGGRMGNGPESSGDGWKYRGQGPIQQTGKANITAFFAAAGLPLDTDPAELQKPDVGAKGAAYFWKDRGCNELADGDQFSQTVFKVNGALPCPENNGPLRKSRYSAAVAALNALAPPAPTPSASTTKKTTLPKAAS